MSRLSWLDVLKGIGIVLVVIGHVYTNEVVYNFLYAFHMPLFFFASGYVYKKKAIRADIVRRVQTIVIPYFSFGILEVVYWQLIERRFRQSDMSFLEAVFGLFGGEFGTLDFNVHLWFLPCFFITMVLYNILQNVFGKRVTYGVAIATAMVFIVLPLPIDNWPVWTSNPDWVDWNGMPALPWGVNRVFRYFAFVAIGDYASSTLKTTVGCSNLKKKLCAVVCAIVMMGCTFAASYFEINKTGIMWFITATIGVAGVTVFSLLINQNRMLQYLGGISLVVLCVHGPVYRVLTKIISIPLHISTETVRENFVLSMIVVGITLLISALIHEVILKIAPWMIGKKYTSSV